MYSSMPVYRIQDEVHHRIGSRYLIGGHDDQAETMSNINKVIRRDIIMNLKKFSMQTMYT